MSRISGNSLEKSSFWGITLDGKNKEHKWDGVFENNDSDQMLITHTLVVRQMVIGADCKEDEVQVIEMETVGFDKKTVRCPIFAGKGIRTVPTEMVVSDQEVVFRLTRGSGPVHLSGTHATEHTLNDDDDEDGLDEEDMEEEEVPQPPRKKGKK